MFDTGVDFETYSLKFRSLLKRLSFILFNLVFGETNKKIMMMTIIGPVFEIIYCYCVDTKYGLQST